MEEIICIIQENSQLTLQGIAYAIDISQSSVEKQVNTLREIGKIQEKDQQKL